MQARVFWQMNPGRNVVNLNWDAINADSVVLVSASEYNSNSQQLPDGTDQRFVGAADVTVANVTPHGPPFDSNQGVTFVVEVGWGAPLTICTDIAVVAAAPDAVVFVGPQTQSRAVHAASTSPVRRSLEAHVKPANVLTATVGAAGGGASGSMPSRSSGNAAGTKRLTRHEATITTGRGR